MGGCAVGAIRAVQIPDAAGNNGQAEAEVAAMTDLLPCPFCGGEAKVGTHENPALGVMWFLAGCLRPCDVSPETKIFGTEAEAIAAWNTRAPQWQPISTAPKKQYVIVYGMAMDDEVQQKIFQGPWVARLANDGWWEMIGNTYVDSPTHWMHLPNPPTEDE